MTARPTTEPTEAIERADDPLCARCGCYRSAHGEGERCEPVGWTFCPTALGDLEGLLLKVRQFILDEYSSGQAEEEGFPVEIEARPAWDALHDALSVVYALEPRASEEE